MRVEDGLVVLLAIGAGGMLLAGLAQALEGRRARGARRGHPRGEPLAADLAPDEGPVDIPIGLWGRPGAEQEPPPFTLRGGPVEEVSPSDTAPIRARQPAVSDNAPPPERERPPAAEDLQPPTAELRQVLDSVHESEPGRASGITEAAETEELRLSDMALAGPAEQLAIVDISPVALTEPLEVLESPLASPDTTPPIGGDLASMAAVEEPPRADLAGPDPSAAVAVEPVPAALQTRLRQSPRSRCGPCPSSTGCLYAYELGEYAVAEADAAVLARTRGGAKRSRRREPAEAPSEQLAAWSVLALARCRLGDEAGARAAFESGARWSAGVAAAPLPGSMASMAPRLGRHLLEAGEGLGEGDDARRFALRLAATWLGAGASADETVAAEAARAGAAFAAAVEAHVRALVARRDFATARRAIDEALADAAIPDASRAPLRDLLWTSAIGEVERLAAKALQEAGRGGHDGMESLAAAGAVIGAVPADTLSAERREDLARRLWSAHIRLGTARRERGDLDGALLPLTRAVELAEADAAGHRKACQALGALIEALVKGLAAQSENRLGAGDLDAALAASRRLSELVDDALQRGLSHEDLPGALGRRQHVLLQISEGRPT